MSKLIYNIFLPSLMVVSLGTSVTGPKILSWWPLLVNAFLNLTLGMCLGAASFRFVRLPKHLWSHYVTTAGVGTDPLFYFDGNESVYFAATILWVAGISSWVL